VYTLPSAIPQGLKPTFLAVVGGTAEQAAEELVEGAKGLPQALKRGHVFNGLRHD
jgi:hypothetical protein